MKWSWSPLSKSQQPMCKYVNFHISKISQQPVCIVYHLYCLPPSTPKTDQHLTSPYNITPKSNIKVMRIEEMIIN